MTDPGIPDLIRDAHCSGHPHIPHRAECALEPRPEHSTGVKEELPQLEATGGRRAEGEEAGTGWAEHCSRGIQGDTGVASAPGLTLSEEGGDNLLVRSAEMRVGKETWAPGSHAC